MFTIKTLNAISPVGLTKLNKNLFDVSVDADAPDGILVRSADLLNTTCLLYTSPRPRDA